MQNRQRNVILTGSFGLLLALSGCFVGCGDKCAGTYCAPCNAFTGDIVVAFDHDSLQGGFRKAEIAGGYAVRYAAPGFGAPVDTVRQIRGGADFYRGLISLGTLPWPGQLGGAPQRSLAAYNYRFVLPRPGRTYDLSSVELQTARSAGDGCCDCGTNTRRRFVLNGAVVVLDGNANNERPAVLRR